MKNYGKNSLKSIEFNKLLPKNSLLPRSFRVYGGCFLFPIQRFRCCCGLLGAYSSFVASFGVVFAYLSFSGLFSHVVCASFRGLFCHVFLVFIAGCLACIRCFLLLSAGFINVYSFVASFRCVFIVSLLLLSRVVLACICRFPLLCGLCWRVFVAFRCWLRWRVFVAFRCFFCGLLARICRFPLLVVLARICFYRGLCWLVCFGAWMDYFA